MILRKRICATERSLGCPIAIVIAMQILIYSQSRPTPILPFSVEKDGIMDAVRDMEEDEVETVK